MIPKKLNDQTWQVNYDNIISRGFRIGKLDSNNEYTTRQWVKVKDIPGCGLLNSVFIQRPEDGTFPMTGSVQYGVKNIYFPLGDISPAKWWQFFFQPKTFGQTSWKAFWIIVLFSCAVGSTIFYTFEDKIWSILGLVPIGSLILKTYHNFIRKTV
jgi:hypothetical protein